MVKVCWHHEHAYFFPFARENNVRIRSIIQEEVLHYNYISTPPTPIRHGQ